MISDQVRPWESLLSLCACFTVLLLLGPLLSLPASAQEGPSRSAVSNRTAKALFVRGLTQSYLQDYEQAISLFEKALDASPRQSAILSALAEAEAGRDNRTSALYYARQAQEYAPEEPYYYHALADLLRDANRPAEAKETYRSLLSRFPNNQAARLSLARLQANTGAPRAALRTYEALVDSSASVQPQAYAEMLSLYQQVGDEDGLERTLKALVDLRHNTPRYREMLGQLYTKQDRYEEAIPLFETLLLKQPSNPRLLSRLKMLYTETGQPQKARTVGTVASETTAPSQLVARARSLYSQAQSSDSTVTQTAIELLQQALDTAPTQVDALDLLGTIYLDRGEYAAAAPLFQQAIDENPRDPTRWRHAATALLRADSARQAAALAEEGQLLFPGRYDLARVEAFARLRLGEYESARDRFREAQNRMDTTSVSAPERADLLAGLGLAQQRLGHIQNAHRTYDAALRVDANAPTALRNYAYSLAQQGTQLDRALALAQRALETAGPTADVLDTLGWVYFKRKNYTQAESTFERALSTGGTSARVYEHFGDVQRALGNESAARTYWQKALERAPDRKSVKRKLDSSPQS